MKAFIQATLVVLLLVFALLVLFAICALNESAAYIESFKEYCPVNHPNTLWTCTEGDIYFASDEDGEVWGASKIGGRITYYDLYFKIGQGEGFVVSELESFAVKPTALPFRFKGNVSFFEDSCTLVYQAADDTAHYFGEREGEVTLTFIKSNLTAPFRFDSERSLSELPFS